MKNITIIIVLAALAFLFFGSPFYVIDETEQAVITMFGKSIGKPITTPGLKFKIPFFYKVNKFPKNLLEWDGDKGQIPTKDKTFIWVDVFGRWKISDPLKFFEKVHDEQSAQANLDGIIDAAVRNLITSHPLIETVRNTDRIMDSGSVSEDEEFESNGSTTITMGRSEICKEILKQARPKLENFGIELVDVHFKRINYAEDVLKKVYERMIAERKQIAEKYRAEGRGESAKIAGEKEKIMKKITSEAYKKVQEIKGKADAKAAEIYANAYGKDPEFYSYTKTLSVYEKSFDSTSTLLMSTGNNFLKYLESYK